MNQLQVGLAEQRKGDDYSYHSLEDVIIVVRRNLASETRYIALSRFCEMRGQ